MIIFFLPSNYFFKLLSKWTLVGFCPTFRLFRLSCAKIILRIKLMCLSTPGSGETDRFRCAFIARSGYLCLLPAVGWDGMVDWMGREAEGAVDGTNPGNHFEWVVSPIMYKVLQDFWTINCIGRWLKDLVSEFVQKQFWKIFQTIIYIYIAWKD